MVVVGQENIRRFTGWLITSATNRHLQFSYFNVPSKLKRENYSKITHSGLFAPYMPRYGCLKMEFYAHSFLKSLKRESRKAAYWFLQYSTNGTDNDQICKLMVCDKNVWTTKCYHIWALNLNISRKWQDGYQIKASHVVSISS